MKTWDEMTDAEKWENTCRWRDYYYKAEIEAAEEEIIKLEAINADLLAVCEAAEKEINKIMHAAFISSTYRGRMNDIRAAAESARKIVAAAAVKVRGE